MPYDVEHEIKLVQYHCARIGQQQPDGTYKTTFGAIFNDPKAEQLFESLVGSLKAARTAGVIKWQGQMLLMPVHKDVEILVVSPIFEDPGPPKPVRDQKH